MPEMGHLHEKCLSAADCGSSPTDDGPPSTQVGPSSTQLRQLFDANPRRFCQDSNRRACRYPCRLSHLPPVRTPAQVVGLSPEILAYVIFLVTLVILSLASLLGGNRQAVAIRRTA